MQRGKVVHKNHLVNALAGPKSGKKRRIMTFDPDDAYEKMVQDKIDEERDQILNEIALEDFNSLFMDLDRIDQLIVQEIYARTRAPKRLSQWP